VIEILSAARHARGAIDKLLRFFITSLPSHFGPLEFAVNGFLLSGVNGDGQEKRGDQGESFEEEKPSL